MVALESDSIFGTEVALFIGIGVSHENEKTQIQKRTRAILSYILPDTKNF